MDVLGLHYKENAMQNITVHRYSQPQAVGYAGWLEPADKSWIAFIDLKGQPTFFLDRDPVSGACLPPDEIAERRAAEQV